MEKNNSSKAVATTGLLIIVIAIYALILSVTLDNDIFTGITASGTITNETISSVSNVTNSTFAIISTYPTATCTLTSVNNVTDGVIIIATGNYTDYSSDCKIIFADASPYLGEDVNTTYGYSYTSNSTLSGVNVTQLKLRFGAFVTAILAFLVIGGTIIGILWFFKYVKPLLSKKEGISGMTA